MKCYDTYLQKNIMVNKSTLNSVINWLVESILYQKSKQRNFSEQLIRGAL